MRTRRSLFAVLAGAALVLAGASACTGPPSEHVASPPPTRTQRPPVFGSLDEALAAAVATFQRYVDLWNQIAADGGTAPERLLEVMESDEAAGGDLATFENLVANDVRVAGSVSFDKARLMQYQDSASLIQMYACFDLSGARLVNREGLDVTPDRNEQVPLMVTFTITDSGAVVISRSEEWDRPGVC